MSTAALRLSDDTAFLSRLTKLYLAGFWLLTAAFYWSLVSSGYEPSLAILTSATGALLFTFMRIARRTGSPALTTARTPAKFMFPTAVLSEKELMVQLALLMHASPRIAGGIGVMLVQIEGEDMDPGKGLPPNVLNLVRGELYRDADSRIYQVDNRTLAIAERRREVALHFDEIAMSLQRELRDRRASRPEFANVRLITGVAVVDGLRAPPEDVLSNARTALRLAETHGRDTFFRHI
jgi:hypothetical protein